MKHLQLETQLSAQEMQDRVSQLKRQLLSGDSMALSELYKQTSDYAFYGFISLIAGIKPSFSFDKETLVPIFLNLIPEKLRQNFDVAGEHLWIYDKACVRKIIIQDRQYFFDFNFEQISNDRYLQKYMNNRNFGHNAPGKYKMQVGLLLGFPRQSVLDFAEGRSTDESEGFNEYGYQFKVAPSESRSFKLKVAQLYQHLGIEQTLETVKRKWQQEYAIFLGSSTDSINIVIAQGRKMLEIHSFDSENGSYEQTHFLLTTQKTTKADFDALLRHVAIQHKQPSVTPLSEKSIGLDYFEYEELFDDSNQDSAIFYITTTETAVERESPVLSVVDRSAFIAWLKSKQPQLAAQAARIMGAR